jgi:hypothetical protein
MELQLCTAHQPQPRPLLRLTLPVCYCCCQVLCKGTISIKDLSRWHDVH